MWSLRNIFVNNIEYTGKAGLCGHALTPAAGMIAEWVALLCSVVLLIELPNGAQVQFVAHAEGLREHGWSSYLQLFLFVSFGSGSFDLSVSTWFLSWFGTSALKNTATTEKDRFG